MATASACSDHDGLDGLENNQLTLSMDVVLAADNAANQTRMVGDPGLAEFFEKPQHLYLFLAVGDPTTPGSNPVYCYQFETNQSKWTRSADSLVFKGRELQTVNWDSDIRLTSDLKCRAYMVASFDAITFNPVISYDDVHRVTSGPKTESELLDLKFYAYDGQNDYANLSLRDVYSSPYNLSQSWTKMSDASTNRTNYYGTVTDIKITGDKGLISINDTLYHTAAKVDFQWNAQSHTQSNVMVNALVDNAPKQGYLFRPSETVSSVGGTYRKVLLSGDNLPEGGNTQVVPGERYIMVEASDMRTYPWDNQFWVVSQNEFRPEDTFEFSVDLRSEYDASETLFEAQIHKGPGDYRHPVLGNKVDYFLDCSTLSSYSWSGSPSTVTTEWNKDDAVVISNPLTTPNWFDLQYWIVGIGSISLKEGQNYKVTINCKAEGDSPANVRFRLGNWDQANSFSTRFEIPVEGGFRNISFDVTPKMAMNGILLQHGDFVGNIYWKSITISSSTAEEVERPTFSEQWRTYHVMGIFPNTFVSGDGIGKSIAFNLSNFASENKYYFKNISFKINGAEQVVNGDLSGTDTQSFYQKIDQGATVQCKISSDPSVVSNANAIDLNNSNTARYANATNVDVGNQWNGRAYTYVLQPGNLTYTLTTSQGGSNQHTATRPASNGKTNDIFAAWYKLDFNIKSAR